MSAAKWWTPGARRFSSISFPARKWRSVPPARTGSCGRLTTWSPGELALLRIRLQPFDLQKPLQMADARGMAHFAERLGFDLADALARDAKLLADFFERARVAVAEAQFQNFPLAFVQAAQHVAQLALEQTEARHVQRAFGGLVLDEIAEARVVAVAHGRLQRDRL